MPSEMMMAFHFNLAHNKMQLFISNIHESLMYLLHPLKNARLNCFTVALQGIVDLGIF